MSTVLKVAAALNVLTALGHAALGLQELFPYLDRSSPQPHRLRAAAKIGWMEGCGFFALSAGLFHKVAELGPAATTRWERLMLLVVFVQNVLAGGAYARTGQWAPLLPLWGTPALMAVGYARGGI